MNSAAWPVFAQVFARLRAGVPFERASANLDPLLHKVFLAETDRVFRQQTPSALPHPFESPAGIHRHRSLHPSRAILAQSETADGRRGAGAAAGVRQRGRPAAARTGNAADPRSRRGSPAPRRAYPHRSSRAGIRRRLYCADCDCVRIISGTPLRSRRRDERLERRSYHDPPPDDRQPDGHGAGRNLHGAPDGSRATGRHPSLDAFHESGFRCGSFARRFFPGKDPLGERFGFPGPGGLATADNQIIGLVSDAKYRSLREPIPPTVYNSAVSGFDSAFTLPVRTQGRPGLGAHAAVSSYWSKLLYDLYVWDAVAAVLVISLIGAIAILATAPAASRAVHVDPASTLRGEYGSDQPPFRSSPVSTSPAETP
jgi:hypothetical protein